MKKQILAALCAAAMLGSMISAPAFAEETVTANGEYKIALITMDSVRVHQQRSGRRL